MQGLSALYGYKYECFLKWKLTAVGKETYFSPKKYYLLFGTKPANNTSCKLCLMVFHFCVANVASVQFAAAWKSLEHFFTFPFLWDLWKIYCTWTTCSFFCNVYKCQYPATACPLVKLLLKLFWPLYQRPWPKHPQFYQTTMKTVFRILWHRRILTQVSNGTGGTKKFLIGPKKDPNQL